MRFGLRVFAGNRASTALIISLLALGTGAGTTMFSLFDATLMRPLAVSHPEQQRRSLKGQKLTINGHVFPIVGVMPRGVNGLSVDSGPDVRVPLRDYALLSPDVKVEQREFEVAGRLKPGVTLAQAQTECYCWRGPRRDSARWRCGWPWVQLPGA